MVTAIPPLRDSEQLEFGDVQSNPIGDRDSSKLVLASYNIRYAVGRFLISSGLLRKVGINRNPKRANQVGENIRFAAEVFNAAKLLPVPDVLALQEADKQTTRAGGHHVARELAEALEMSWVHVPAGIPRGRPPVARQWWLDFEEQIGLHDTGDTGVALLSRLPLEEVTRIDLPWHECPWRPRLAMAATVSLGDKKLRIVNAHVDPHAAIGGQLEQLEVLTAEAEKHVGPTLVVGDFNTLSRQKCAETKTFMEARGFHTPIPTGTPTWRGAGIRLHADWIFYRDLKITKWGVARPLSVSDHWPIWAEIVVE
jgi:endonuclease/exonuclease/phosphatase family metal-dependent hydrolase